MVSHLPLFALFVEKYFLRTVLWFCCYFLNYYCFPQFVAFPILVFHLLE